jgi:hypothetical protein
MRSKMKFAGIGLMLVAAAAFAADAVVLKMVYKKDQVTKYRMKGTLDFGGQTIEATILTKDTVKEIAADGTVTVENETVEGKISFGGQEMEIPASPATRMTMKPNGEIKEIKGDEVNATVYRLQNLQGFIPPAEAVTVGSKWVRKGSANKDTGAVAFTASYEIVGEEKIGEYDTFKIKYKNIETEGNEPAAIEGTVWVSKADCSIVKGTAKWMNVPMAGAPMPINGEFTLTREG